MKSFKYTVAASESDASKKLGPGAVALAGGSNLMNLMKEHVVEPDVVVDIKKIPDASGIAVGGPGSSIGANTTIAEIVAHEGLAESYPAIVQAAASIATPQVRNRATLGGNLCARPACWYFTRNGFDCRKRGSSGCAAKEGENEFHAIFETDGPCVMVHPSSLAPALIAYGATAVIAGPNGRREVALSDFFVSPSQDFSRENVLAENEILVGVELGEPSSHGATYQVRQKASHDWPVAQASVALEMRFGACTGARIVLGAVAPTPRRVEAAEAELIGKSITREVAEAAAAKAVEGARALAQNSYKIQATRAAVTRAVLLAGTGKWS